MLMFSLSILIAQDNDDLLCMRVKQLEKLHEKVYVNMLYHISSSKLQ